jgi:hypothetical protein
VRYAVRQVLNGFLGGIVFTILIGSVRPMGLGEPRQPDQEENIGPIFVDPGNYTWSAHSLDNYSLVDEHGDSSFEITLGPGDMYGSGCCK